MSIPLFDSLTHPLLEGTWFGRESSFDRLASELESVNVIRACAVGISSVGGYQHEAFARACAIHERLVPVAGVHPEELSTRPNLVAELREMGYRAVKVHPRFSRIALSDPRLGLLLSDLERHRLPLFLCTYAHTALELYPQTDPFYDTVRLLKSFPSLKVVLLHGGNVNLLSYSELVRHNPNLLLDVSFTMSKYEGSSLDLDLAYLFKSLDERICVGSDYPEFSLSKTRERFEVLAHGVDSAKVANMAYANLSRFLSVDL